jgi:F-type H+-transporting ATPase subunit epsilon
MLLTVITPTKKVFSEEIDELVVHTTNGEIGILPHHMPLVTSVLPGEMIMKIKGREQHYAITGGFLEVGEEGITVLADYAIQSEEIEVEKAMEAKQRAEEVLKRSREEGVSERDFAAAEAELRKAVLQINVAHKRRRERNPLSQK